MNVNKNKELFFDKLAVFDLDGTLYECNSHIELLNQRYKMKVFDCILVKVFGKIFSRSYLRTLNRFYKKVPIEFIKNFTPDFRESALDLLEKKKQEGYHIVIVSNAPKELIEIAAKRLDVDWFQAEINRKNEVVIQNYKYSKLFVCTDNISDINLLDIANEKVIYVTKKTKSLFSKKYPRARILEV